MANKSKSGTLGNRGMVPRCFPSHIILVVLGLALVIEMLVFGLEVPNADQLAELHEKAKAGDAEAQVNLAHVYWYNGDAEIPLSSTNSKSLKIEAFMKCAKWAEKSASQGNREARVFLDDIYDKGSGVATNSTQIFEFCRRSAEAGNPIAQLKLAKKLESGAGTLTNLVESYAWYSVAISNRVNAAEADAGMKRIEISVVDQLKVASRIRTQVILDRLSQVRD